ncbi:hypothetical protein [Veillonella seminalis]|uniref:Uncharacterized protein n=1 Tax=Veillonella seminalis ACS-216-V-Col6b TaxID=883156 RepID=K9DLR5_9FIRM|nr:hypothetical protein [Veillonella seminalis]EKU78310.1 hypothetical protein HMPREF9282_01216 [Veillonella seminalis ACS-216-V-Col6b]
MNFPKEENRNERQGIIKFLNKEFKPKSLDYWFAEDENEPKIVKKIIEELKKIEGLTYAEAYGILQAVKQKLEFESNFVSLSNRGK